MVAKREPFADDIGTCASAPDENTDAHRRLCALSRQAKSREDLIRFVASPDGILVPDLAQKLPGRGVWITADRTSVDHAVRKKAFERSLKTALTVNQDLGAQTDKLLETNAVQALALANKAGQMVCGFDKCAAVIDRGEAIAMLHGLDAAPGGRRKLDGKFRAISSELSIPAPIIDDFTIDQMSLAMGRSNVVHAALLAGGAARNAVLKIERLTRYRSGFD